jgi:hypothetical protein
MASSPDPPPDGGFLHNTLWRLQFADGNVCVAEVAKQVYLVLFTSLERAREFLEVNSLMEPSPINAVIFSESGAQFERRARLAVEEGVSGAVIDPQPGGLRMLVDFGVETERPDGP